MKDKHFIRRDCRHFTGEMPCGFHKTEGALCSACARYSPEEKKILIIKLGAMGDVLRTTPILPALREKYPRSRITWVTENGSGELLRNIPELDLVLELSASTLAYLAAVEFDMTLSLDPAVAGGALAENVRSKQKKGFGLDSRGKLFPYDDDAREWFLSGIFDELKKENKRTYQSFLFQAAGLPFKNHEMILNLTDEEKEKAESFRMKKNIQGGKPIVGVNTGAGGRWKLKSWTEEGFLELIRLLAEEDSLPVILFGGPLEKERNGRLIACSPAGVFNAGTDNSPREFLSLLNLCDVIVSGDTFAMHAAAGLGKKVAALFGPTSAAEIELYGRGKKIVSPADCVCCYRDDCLKHPNCMELIKPETVREAVRSLV